MKAYHRADRVSCRIQQVLSDLLAKKIKDPRLAMTVITDVRLTADLRLARVYFTTSAASSRSQSETLDALNHALGYIKRALAQELALRYMPELQFFYDRSIEYGTHIDNLLKSIQSNDEIGYSTTDDPQ